MSRAAWVGSVAQWGSFFAAICALGISGATAYYTVFWYREELRVAVDTWPKHDVDVRSSHMYIEGPLRALFINSGNRPIAILNTELLLHEGEGPVSAQPPI
jgi:hypothetical protein